MNAKVQINRPPVLNSLFIIAAQVLQYLQEINLCPGCRKGMVIETVVESSLNYLYQDVCERFVHVTVLIWMLLGGSTFITVSVQKLQWVRDRNIITNFTTIVNPVQLTNLAKFQIDR